MRVIHRRSYNHVIRQLQHVSCLLLPLLVMTNGETSDLRRHQLEQLTRAYCKVLLHVDCCNWESFLIDPTMMTSRFIRIGENFDSVKVGL